MPACPLGTRRLAIAPPATRDQADAAVTGFFAGLSVGPADAGCTLVGHIKGAIADGGGLTFHATTLGVAPALTGGLGGTTRHAVLTVNVFVFGAAEGELPAIVTDA